MLTSAPQEEECIDAQNPNNACPIT